MALCPRVDCANSLILGKTAHYPSVWWCCSSGERYFMSDPIGIWGALGLHSDLLRINDASECTNSPVCVDFNAQPISGLEASTPLWIDCHTRRPGSLCAKQCFTWARADMTDKLSSMKARWSGSPCWLWIINLLRGWRQAVQSKQHSRSCRGASWSWIYHGQLSRTGTNSSKHEHTWLYVAECTGRSCAQTFPSGDLTKLYLGITWARHGETWTGTY